MIPSFFALDLRAGKSGFALFDQFTDGVPFPLESLGPRDTVHDFTRGKQQAENDQLFDRVGVGSRGVKDDDTLGGALVDGDIVDAGAGTGNGGELIAERHIV